MAKKIAEFKKSTKKSNLISYLRSYFFLIVVSVFSFSATSLVLSYKQIQPVCANTSSCVTDLTEKVENNSLGVFLGRTVVPPKLDLRLIDLKSSILGENTALGKKHIFVDLSTQELYAYQENTLILKTYISSGKWGRTPVGNFHIWQKLRATRMSGGQGSDAYDLPNVPYVMYFYHDFGLHGAYWHNNFGHVMSHGCVNMRAIDAKILYEWTDGPSGNTPGTAVSVCNELTPSRECIQINPVK